MFVQVSAAVRAGFAESMSRPGGNATGFEMFPDYGVSAKWLELLKRLISRVTRAGVLRDPSNPNGIGLMAAMRGVAPGLEVELSPLGVRDAPEIERAIVTFAQRTEGHLADLHPSAVDHRSRGTPPTAHDLSLSLLRRRWRADLLRARRDRAVSAGGRLRRSHPKGRSRPICRCRRRPSTNWCLIVRLPRRLAWNCR
jgi:hypothetical protein